MCARTNYELRATNYARRITRDALRTTHDARRARREERGAGLRVDGPEPGLVAYAAVLFVASRYTNSSTSAPMRDMMNPAASPGP